MCATWCWRAQTHPFARINSSVSCSPHLHLLQRRVGLCTSGRQHTPPTSFFVIVWGSVSRIVLPRVKKNLWYPDTHTAGEKHKKNIRSVSLPSLEDYKGNNTTLLPIVCGVFVFNVIYKLIYIVSYFVAGSHGRYQNATLHLGHLFLLWLYVGRTWPYCIKITDSMQVQHCHSNGHIFSSAIHSGTRDII